MMDEKNLENEKQTQEVETPEAAEQPTEDTSVEEIAATIMQHQQQCAQ